MRLVARKLHKKEAKKRIEGAKKDRHSKEYYELLKYEIYLTNIDSENLNAKEIAKLCGLHCLPRGLGGYIEIIFNL